MSHELPRIIVNCGRKTSPLRRVTLHRWSRAHSISFLETTTFILHGHERTNNLQCHNNHRFLQTLKHNLFKDVSKGLAILWQTLIQTIEYGLKNTIRIKRMKFYWYFIHLHPLIWIFKQSWCPKLFFQNFCHKKAGPLTSFIVTLGIQIIYKFISDGANQGRIFPQTCQKFYLS